MVLRLHPEIEKKIRRTYIKMRTEYPRKRITIVNITANIDYNEQEIIKRLLERKKRGNRYFY